MKKISLTEEKKEISGLFRVIKKRDFQGYTGVAVKNSIYQLSTSIVGKFGGLLFTILMARILMPELFGLYSLIISTVFIFISLADLGIGSAIIKFTSTNNPKNGKAKGNFIYILKLKILVVSVLVVALLLSSKFLAENYYQKPIFLGLLAGIFYLVAFGFNDFIQYIFQSVNNFKPILYKEIFTQIMRLLIVPLLTLYLLKQALSQEVNLFWIVLALSFVYFLSLVFLLLISRNKFPFMETKAKKPSKKEMKKIFFFILPLSATVLTETFFGNVDILMLGKFVSASLIGFYKATFTLVLSIAPLLAFSTVLYPIFTKLKGKRLEDGLKRSVRIILPLSIIIFLGIFLFAPLIIKIILGNDYMDSVTLLRVFSVIMLSLPITQIYSSYLISKGKSSLVMKFILMSTVMNILLNVASILWLLPYGEWAAVYGVAGATILSRYFLLSLYIFAHRKERKNWRPS